MLVQRNPTTQTVTVELTLGAAVRLADAELWQYVPPADTKLAVASQNESTATWTLPAPGGSDIHLTVYWNAIEPMHDKWVYDAVLIVRDQSGVVLPGVGGQANPSHTPSQIGTHKPSFGRGMQQIQINQ